MNKTKYGVQLLLLGKQQLCSHHVPGGVFLCTPGRRRDKTQGGRVGRCIPALNYKKAKDGRR